jgi:hypothetical protein
MDLDERLAYWQRQLRLQDWDVTISWASARELGEANGRTSLINTSKEAHVRILEEDEWPPESERTGHYDSEVTLVHELLHLHFRAWEGEAEESDTAEYRAKEAAIDLTSWALVRLDRGERR